MKRKRGDYKRLYWVWGAMIQRCHNPKNPGFKNYGARGVVVCDRWRDSFDAFVEDMGLPSNGEMIDRVDSSGPYSRENCRWTSRQIQNSNRPNWCRYCEIGGERLTMKDAWRKHAHPSVTYRSFVKRIVTRGWTVEQALSTPAPTRRAA